MARRALRDDQWKKIKDFLPGKKTDPGRTARNNRKFIDAILWIARTGAHGRELTGSLQQARRLSSRPDQTARTPETVTSPFMPNVIASSASSANSSITGASPRVTASAPGTSLLSSILQPPS